MGILSGIPQDASKGQGGIYLSVYLAPKSAISGFTQSVSGGTNGYASFSAPAGIWQSYHFGKQSNSSWEVKGTGNVAKGSYSYEHSVNMTFRRNQNQKRNEIFVLAQNELIAAIQDNNGRTVILGGYMGLDLETETAQTGSQFADANERTVVLKCLEPKPEYDLFPSKWAAIVANSAVTAA